MNVLIAALELAPYLKSTPSAESVASLAKSLRLLGHDVTVCVPRLSCYEESGLLAARQLSPLELDHGRTATLYDTQLPSGVQLTLMETEGASFVSGEPFDTQASALGAFTSSVAALVARQAAAGSPFDVVHAHDAAAGLALLKVHGELPVGDRVTARVLTIHDAARSGEFPAEDREALGIPEERAGTQGFGSGEGLCLLKGLVSEADAIVIPSESYGRQIKAPEKYGALSRAFQAVTLHGIHDGVDYAVFNPATDSALTSRYDAPDPSNKARNKVAVLDELSLDFDISRPVLFCEDVPTGDSAIETLLSALPALIRHDVTLIIAGAPDKRSESADLLQPFASQVKWLQSMDPSLRRRVLAASDFYLSLNRRDPSGQQLLQASRYGAIPIALRVDAVTDVIVDADAELRTGTGIVFESMTQRALVSAVARAITAFRSEAFPRLLSRVMRQDLGWDRAARRHVQVYRNAASSQL